MILCLESSLLGGYLSNEVPGLVTGKLHLAGVREAIRVELVGNFMRDIAGCRVDFHNPLPNANLDDVAWISRQQIGSTGIMTASNRVAKMPRRRKQGDPLLPIAQDGLKNLLFFEWFNQQAQRILIQSWYLQLRVSAPCWQMTPEEEAQQTRQARARRKHFLLGSREGAESAAGPSEMLTPGLDGSAFEPQAVQGNPFDDMDEPGVPAARPLSELAVPEEVDPNQRCLALAQELKRFETLLNQACEIQNRPAVVKLLSTVADLAKHLIHVLRLFPGQDRSAWKFLVVDLEQSLPLFSAALNATDKVVQHATPGTDHRWLTHVQASLLNVELRMRELLVQLR
jgi:hypothetical protein